MAWPLDLLASLAVPALAALGWPAILALRKRAELDGATSFAASFALGLGFVQAAGMLLGFTGMLRAWAVLASLGLGAAVSAALWLREGRPLPGRPAFDLAAAAAALAFVPILLMATVPPWYRDEMTYHLSLPRAFAVAGRYVQPDDNIFASFPLGWESILAVLHALGAAPDRFPPFNPRLVGAWTTLGAAVAAAGLARAAGVGPRLARWAAPLFLLVPTVLEFGASAYVEPYLVLWGTLGLTAVLHVQSGRPALLPAALCAGAAASTKYPGLALCFFLGVLLLTDLLRRDPEETKAAFRRLLVYSFAALALASPFYVRNLVERGNPFFPVAFDLLEGKGWDARRAAGYAATLDHYGMGRAPLDLLLLPFRMFTATSLHHSFEGSLGPVYGLGALAGIVFVLRALRSEVSALPRRPLASVALFALLWTLFWFNTVQQVRYYLVALPALIVLLLVALEIGGRARPRLARGTLALAVAGSVAWGSPLLAELWNRQSTGAWLSGQIGREELLSRALPESYAFEAELEALVPTDGRIWLVWTRTHTYYLRRDFREDMVFEAWRFEALLDRSEKPAAALAEFRRDGITHLLVHHRFFLQNGNADLEPGRTQRLQSRFVALVAGRVVEPLRSWGPLTLYAVKGL